MSEVLDGERHEGGLEDYGAWGREERDECGVTGLMETSLGRACRAGAVEAYVKRVSALSMMD